MEVVPKMTREFIPGMNHARIVSYLLEGKSVREIARKSNQNPGNIMRTIKRLESHGYIVREVRTTQVIYTLTIMGFSLLEMLGDHKGNTPEKSLTGVNIGATPERNSPKMWRLHALQFKIPLVEALRAEDIHLIQFRDHPTKLRNLKNHSDLIVEFQNFTVTLSTRSIKITGIEVRTPYEEEEPETLLEKAKEIFSPEIENIEMILRKKFPRVRLRRLARGVIDINVVKGELALENDDLAVKVGDIQKKTNQKLKVYDPEDGVLSEIVDFSNGPPEFEGVHPKKFIDHMTIYKNFLDDLNSGKFYQTIGQIVESQKQMQEAQERILEIHKDGFKQHDERINQVLDVVERLAVSINSTIQNLVTAIGGR